MRFFVTAFCVLFLLAPSFAQVRDLFAEFDEETKTADSSAVVSSSSLAGVSSSSENMSSAALSAENVSSSSSETGSDSLTVPLSSSSGIASSSSEIPLSSSAENLREDSLRAALPVADSLGVPPSDTASVADSTSALGGVSSSDSASVSGSAESSSSEARSSSSSSSVLAASSSSISRRDILGPVKVSKVYGIDEMKGRYKSPRKALFLSLVVPGSGQLYVGGSTFNYVRGAAYLALEAGLWGSWYYYSVHKYDRQVSRYKKFAKNNFSASKYEEKIHDLRNSLDDSDEESKFVERYLSSRESYCKSIYGNAATNNCYAEGKELTGDQNHIAHIRGDDFSLYNSGSYYSNIASSAYVLGWNDVTDETPVSALNLSKNSETVPLGISQNMKIYRGMRSKANDYADMQAWFFGGIILNHLVSALDAAWAAHSHNKVLYEEELSWYDRLHFEGGFVPMDSRSVLNVYLNF